MSAFPWGICAVHTVDQRRAQDLRVCCKLFFPSGEGGGFDSFIGDDGGDGSTKRKERERERSGSDIQIKPRINEMLQLTAALRSGRWGYWRGSRWRIVDHKGFNGSDLLGNTIFFNHVFKVMNTWRLWTESNLASTKWWWSTFDAATSAWSAVDGS